jgi:hypothetical protein
VKTTPAQEWDGRLVLAPGHGLPMFADVDGGGVAAAAAIERKCSVRAIEGAELRRPLNAGGACLDDRNLDDKER